MSDEENRPSLLGSVMKVAVELPGPDGNKTFLPLDKVPEKYWPEVEAKLVGVAPAMRELIDMSRQYQRTGVRPPKAKWDEAVAALKEQAKESNGSLRVIGSTEEFTQLTGADGFKCVKLGDDPWRALHFHHHSGQGEWFTATLAMETSTGVMLRFQNNGVESMQFIPGEHLEPTEKVGVFKLAKGAPVPHAPFPLMDRGGGPGGVPCA
jgi:hypothetical protein